MADPLTVYVRPCFEQDVQAVQFIYAHHVSHGFASFEIEPPSYEEMRERWAHIVGEGWPFLVATTDMTRVVGFAYAAPFHKRAAYAQTFESSVYVAPSLTGKGVGTALLTHLLVELHDQGVRQVVAQIGDSENTSSIKLHAKLGFEHAGKLRSVGFKFGRWVDVVLMQRRLA